jgi:carbamoyl-phosphate synthase small subunit
MTPIRFAERGIRVHVLPATSTLEDVKAVNPDGFFMSNGPGDPATADAQVKLLRSVLDEKLPYFGICFGNQLLGRALGFRTYKLPFGHRGINQPVLDKATGRVEITSQNHGFAVDMPIEGELDSRAGFGRVEVSHYSLNDKVVEGIRCLDIPAFSVQYHPESAAGPHDANHLFDRFREVVVAHKAAAGAGDSK